MGLLLIAALVLVVVFPVPALITAAVVVVLIALASFVNGVASLLGKASKITKADGPDPWAVACQPLSIRASLFRLFVFMLCVLIVSAVTAAALAYAGPVASGLLLLCVSAALYVAYVKAVL